MIFRRKKGISRRLTKKLKKKLEKEKKEVEKQLSSFAKKDKKLKGDWDSKYPKFNGGAGGEMLEDEAKEVEEYSTRLPLEHSLELRLRDINLALKKIEEGNYGICEKCDKKISKERLKAYPAARTCIKCKK